LKMRISLREQINGGIKILPAEIFSHNILQMEILAHISY
jgi:hypothetical protein